jgi:hypothetical protein
MPLEQTARLLGHNGTAVTERGIATSSARSSRKVLPR